MDMIKRLFFVLAVAVCAASCLDNDGKNYTNSYTLAATFEYGAGVFQSDSLTFEKQNGYGLGWQDLGFYHKLNKEKTAFEGGFILSRLKANGDTAQDRFRSVAGPGQKGSTSYLVYYANPDESKMPPKDFEFMAANIGSCEMIGCYVTNTKEVADAVRSSFVDGDRFAVKMTGYKGGQVAGSKEFVLAEYTEQKDSIVTKWSPFELDKLGQVDSVNIEVVTNRNDIPKAFCMDDLFAKIVVSY